MSSFFCDDVKWDGQYITLKWSLQNEVDCSTIQLLLKERKTQKTINVEVDFTQTDSNLVTSIKANSLNHLTAGIWDFYLKKGRNRKVSRISLNAKAVSNEQTRYYIPFYKVGKNLNCTLYLTEDYGVSLRYASEDILESKAYNVVTYQYVIEGIKDNYQELRLQVTLSKQWHSKTILIIKNEYGERYEMPAIFQNQDLVIEKEGYSFLQGKCSFYLQRKEGRILEQVHLFIDEKSSRLWEGYALKTTRYEHISISETASFKLQVKESNRPDHIISGELIAEDLTMTQQCMSFHVSLDEMGAVEDWTFFLKRKSSEEKLYLRNTFILEANIAVISIEMEQTNFIVSKGTTWILHAEKRHINYIEERKVGLYQASLPTRSDRYIGFYELTDEIGAVPIIQKTRVYAVSFMTRQQYFKLKAPADVSIHSLKMKKGIMTLTVSIALVDSNAITFNGLRLIERNEHKRIIELQTNKKVTTKNGRIKVTSVVDLNQLDLDPFYWDFYASISMDHLGDRDIRIYSDHYGVIKKLRHFMFKYTLVDEQGYMTYPYLTVNGGLSITHRKKGEYEERKNKWTEYAAYFYYHFFYQFFSRKPVWLVHEKFSETAQDNSFYFFRYCYMNHPQRKVYYVIKKGALDEKNVNEYKDRVVYFMSFKHLVLLLSSKMIISSEAKGHGYAWRVSQGVIKKFVTEKKYIFLQHGVLGLKKVDSTFDYNTQNSAELFVASSDYEKSIITKYFGYSNNHVIVTGLPRWDVLEDKTNLLEVGKKREILLMPTWRNWLEEVEETDFVKSDYFHAYNSLLQSEKLHQVLSEHNLLLNFYVHPKFMPYVKTFTKSSEHVRVFQFGEEKVNELIMKANLLITDYSSVSWEMYYLRKPVIFFQFDLDQYTDFQGSYMDLNKELFGEAVFNPEDLIASIDSTAKNGFIEKPEFAQKRNEYFKFVDRDNSKRIFKEIMHKEKDIDKQKSFLDVFRHSDMVKVLWRRYRKLKMVQRFGRKFLNRHKQ
ncbi:CDP-glycerol glycerophosphotransferase family protein [Alkalicoccobacillus porphyridii]|uniref:Teichoic acid biosynthesis protein n=1 Tax=Alkalicoccobacillus porphyridii TaxID=2597270 RepID=A0A554A3W5_9BACI|nr:CDP-glycerol glycerophosphotransferase family protein [Alkalicoccobacillus porphyridii]TSB48380.1 hypothetical protein FN960_02160 [Alkalicoccobacillus porphyridii]